MDDGLWRPRIYQPGSSLSRPASAPCLRVTPEKSEKVSPPRSTRSTRSLLRKGGFSALAEGKTSKSFAEAKTIHPLARLSRFLGLCGFIFLGLCCQKQHVHMCLYFSHSVSGVAMPPQKWTHGKSHREKRCLEAFWSRRHPQGRKKWQKDIPNDGKHAAAMRTWLQPIPCKPTDECQISDTCCKTSTTVN